MTVPQRGAELSLQMYYIFCISANYPHYSPKIRRNVHFVYCPITNAIYCAKLGKIFEEALIRRREVQFFSGSSIQFLLYLLYVCVIKSIEISPFRDVLSDEFIRIFDTSFLP